MRTWASRLVLCLLLSSAISALLFAIGLKNESTTFHRAPTIKFSFSERTEAPPAFSVTNSTGHEEYFVKQIMDDLRPFRKGFVVETLIAKYEIGMGDLALIFNNTLSVSVGKTQKAKRRLWTRTMKMLLKQSLFPDVLFLIQFRSRPKESQSDEPAAPTFSMAKAPYHKDVLYPNPYFFHYLGARKTLLRAGLKPWSTRQSIAFWRGACRQSRSRAELVRQRQRGVLNARITSRCESNAWPFVDQQWVKDLPTSPRYPLTKMAMFKYLIVMPGSTAGSYSKAMQYLSSLGAVILFWENEFFEFYYHRLKEGVHFLRVNRSSIIPTIKYLQNNDGLAKQIAASMNSFVQQRLNQEHITAYYRRLLLEYSTLQRFEVPVSLRQLPHLHRGENGSS